MATCSKLIRGIKATTNVKSPEGKSTIILWTETGSAELTASAIIAGECAIIPTETIYGLTCDALKERAVRRLFDIKGRDISKPSAVMLENVNAILSVAEIGSLSATRIINRFLPGPITVVLQSKMKPVAGVVSHDGKIGIRVSSHPFVQSLCHLVGSPIIATSANLSGAEDCRTDAQVLKSFAGQVAVIILESSSSTAKATTVVDLTTDQPRLLREGTIPFSEVLNCAEGRTNHV